MVMKTLRYITGSELSQFKQLKKILPSIQRLTKNVDLVAAIQDKLLLALILKKVNEI